MCREQARHVRLQIEKKANTARHDSSFPVAQANTRQKRAGAQQREVGGGGGAGGRGVGPKDGKPGWTF